jgi:hypothetical protein
VMMRKMSLETPSLSPTLSNLIAEINYSIDSVKEKILAAYEYAIDKDGFTPKAAAKLIRDKTEYSDSYIRKVLPLESKDTSKTNKPSSDALLESHKSQDKDENVVNITTAYDIKEAETVPSPLEEFRQKHGTKMEEQEELRDLPEPTDIEEKEPEDRIIYDKQFVDQLVKENAQLVTQFTFDYDLEVKDQVLPLKVIVYPDKRTGVVRLRKTK